MTKLTRHARIIKENIDKTKQYEINEAITLLKRLSSAKFTESIDVSIRLDIDTRKSNQNIRGAVVLPHGTGRSVRIAVFTKEENVQEAKIAGAIAAGTEDLAEHIKKGKTDFNVIVASPDVMYIVNQLGHILGPRGLMPNPKIGTLTQDVIETVKKIKAGQIHYRNDKNGNVHTTIGKANFETNKLKENLEFLVLTLKKIKPASIKGSYIKKISISSTMGAGITVNLATLNAVIN